jgi:hypothetical protein
MLPGISFAGDDVLLGEGVSCLGRFSAGFLPCFSGGGGSPGMVATFGRFLPLLAGIPEDKTRKKKKKHNLNVD